MKNPASRRRFAALATALLVAVGSGIWLEARGLGGQAEQAAQRSAMLGLRALTEAVERLGLESEGLQTEVAAWVAADPVIEVARVVQFQGIRLMASTAAADAGEQAAPRKMAREEKPFYDLGQALRAAVESNLQEGRAFKEEIDLKPRPDGGLALAAPVESDGAVTGAVLIETAPPPPPAGVAWLAAIGAVAAPLLLFALLQPLLGERRWAALGVAALLVVAAVWGHGRLSLGTVAEARRADETALAERLRSRAGAAEEVLLAAGRGAVALDPASWDGDRFRRPLGLLRLDGVREPELERHLAAQRAAYWKLMTPFALLALLLLGWVGLGGAERTGSTLVKHRQAYLYVLPAMIGMLLLVFLPFFYGILLSFTNSNIYNTDRGLGEIWVGVENYIDIVTDFELVKTTPEGRVYDYQNFYWTLGFTIVWTITNVAIGVTFGLLLALILNRRGFVLKPIYRVLLILPWAVPNYITALIWQGMFHSQFGVINQIIQIFGGEALSWFDTPFKAFITVLSTNGWLSFPFMMVISLGALQSIPADLYEAARVDGASRWHQFKKITLPSLKPALVPAVILSVVWTFNQFNVIYLVSAGEPAHATEILITEAYKIAFEQYRYGYAAAYSVLIFVILLVYGIWQNRVTRATEGI